MAPLYLVQCACGAEHPVAASRAGDEFVCSCGETVVVPALRQLRQLPPRNPETTPQASRSWSPAHGLLAVGLVAAGTFLLVDVWQQRRLPPRPTFDIAGQQQALESRLAQATPVDVWQHWSQTVLPLKDQALQRTRSPEEIHFQAAASQTQRYRSLLWFAAGVAGLLALVGIGMIAAQPRAT